MQIHVIQSGQTLYGIANAYEISMSKITEANQLSAPSNLVVGQTLVIPLNGMYYWVQSGDSLYTIAQRFGTSVSKLAEINQQPLNRPLQIGKRLYIPAKTKQSAEVNAYIEPRGEALSQNSLDSATEAAPNLTYLAPFSFQIQRDGSLKALGLDKLPSIAEQKQVTLMMVVTNLENAQFSSELGSIILNDPVVQNRLLENIIDLAKQLDFKDIHFDIEFLKPEDREAYNAFLRKAADRIHQEGFLLSTALAPKTSAAQTGPWYTAHDYKAHGEIADFVIIMTYEWGYSGGPPMAVSPIGPVRKVLEYAISEIPATKVMMGQNLYGYDWTLPFVAGGPYAKALSPQAAIDLARDRRAAIQYDYLDQAPYFNYWDDLSKKHKVWFEDARSIQAKFNLIKELGLRGISYWKLGLSFPQNWLLIQDNFNVIKR
ncbi:LysM peptidoglycan-binding domain-containing protein [Paenibacillus psychroresistens]|uniref:LysM peptidoglycan-binding domain-containing protein n=1 Tax=Paenibacillus psychroresistens TaxID=1778678 RepID=A0A6B8RFT8_9BACL|nr:glycoside hydrolase family 18 protein [Paenibacillus psychroresistens]QGQ95040.1 LysM peptidoglycan-binding domain-containing protein [Paenibacillus psychroresistens]